MDKDEKKYREFILNKKWGKVLESICKYEPHQYSSNPMNHPLIDILNIEEPELELCFGFLIENGLIKIVNGGTQVKITPTGFNAYMDLIKNGTSKSLEVSTHKLNESTQRLTIMTIALTIITFIDILLKLYK